MADRLVIAISGASGAMYGVRLLQVLRETEVETHLIMSKAAHITLAQETDFSVADVQALADVCYQPGDIAAAISSGSFGVMGMIVAPCSVKTLAEIATGVTTSLISRAADVALKERRKLVLMVRESPLHAGHIRNMQTVADMGGIIAPPMPAFYPMPETVDDIINHSVGRLLDLFGMDTGLVRRWKGLNKAA